MFPDSVWSVDKPPGFSNLRPGGLKGRSRVICVIFPSDSGFRFMPRQRFCKLPAEKQALILETAGREFAAHGYDGASLNQVLRAAGISKGAAYYYFMDKSDLYLTVLQYYWDRVMAVSIPDMERITAESFWDEVGGVYRAMLSRCVESPWIFGLAWSVWKLPRDTRIRGQVGQVFDLLRGWYVAVVSRGRELGVIRDDVPGDLIINLLAAMDETNSAWLKDHWNEYADPEREAADLHVKMFGMIRGMFAPEATAGGNGVHQ